jgi:hypothetical protein
MKQLRAKETEDAPQSSTRRTSRCHRPPGCENRRGRQGSHARPGAGGENGGRGRGRDARPRSPPPNLTRELVRTRSGAGPRSSMHHSALAASRFASARADCAGCPAAASLQGSEDFYPEDRPRRPHRRLLDGRSVGHSRRVPSLRAGDRVDDRRGAALDAGLYPDADPELLVPGSLVFRKTAGPLGVSYFPNWWEYRRDLVVAGLAQHDPGETLCARATCWCSAPFPRRAASRSA